MASILPSRRDMRLEKEPAGSAALERGLRAALAYVLRREHLRRTVDGIARVDDHRDHLDQVRRELRDPLHRL